MPSFPQSFRPWSGFCCLGCPALISSPQAHSFPRLIFSRIKRARRPLSEQATFLLSNFGLLSHSFIHYTFIKNRVLCFQYTFLDRFFLTGSSADLPFRHPFFSFLFRHEPSL